MKLIVLLLTVICFSQSSFAQTGSKLFTGVIVSEDDNRPLEGASVRVKGTKNYSGAQPDGVYFINVQKTDSVLVFAYDGHASTEVRLTGEKEYNVRLRRLPSKPTPVSTGSSSLKTSLR